MAIKIAGGLFVLLLLFFVGLECRGGIPESWIDNFPFMVAAVLVLGLIGGVFYLLVKTADWFETLSACKRLRKLAEHRTNGFEAFWEMSDKHSAKDITEFIYLLMKNYIEVLDMHPDFPIYPTDDLMNELGLSGYVIEDIFDITYGEFVEEDGDCDEPIWIQSRLKSTTVEEFVTKVGNEIRPKA